MKGFRIFTKSLLIALIFSTAAFAQTAVKIGAVDTSVFYDKEKGIKEIIIAQEKLDDEFRTQLEELKALIDQIRKLEEELQKFKTLLSKPVCIDCVDTERLLKIADEYEKLTCKLLTKQSIQKAQYDKRKAEIFADIYKRIGDAIKKFAREKSYVVIVDASKTNDGSILMNPEPDDVTEAFIKYYNEIYTKLKTQ